MRGSEVFGRQFPFTRAFSRRSCCRVRHISCAAANAPWVRELGRRRRREEEEGRGGEREQERGEGGADRRTQIEAWQQPHRPRPSSCLSLADGRTDADTDVDCLTSCLCLDGDYMTALTACGAMSVGDATRHDTTGREEMLRLPSY